MGDRGRTSSAEFAVVPIEKTERALPPVDLTTDQQNEWNAIVDRLPADWFPRESLALLTQYVRHQDASNKVAQLISSVEKQGTVDVDEYDKLLKMQEREGRAMSSLATRMRMTQQSTYDPKKKKGKGTDRPWET